MSKLNIPSFSNCQQLFENSVKDIAEDTEVSLVGSFLLSQAIAMKKAKHGKHTGPP